MKLVIVETPAQAKIVAGILGAGWRVEPCHGVLRDLPADTLGVEVVDDFRATFLVPPAKRNLTRRLTKAMRESEAVFLATPPGRAGEWMAWHVLALLPDAAKPVSRVSMSALTPEEIGAAFEGTRSLDEDWVEAELTARTLERLAGWGVNAALSRALDVPAALTYEGMVALRLLPAREAEIAAFVPVTSWRTQVQFGHAGVPFTADVLNTKGTPLVIRSEEQAAQLQHLLRASTFWVEGTTHEEVAHPAPEPLTLRALVTAADRDLHLAPDRTLELLATLYDAGWITHPERAPLPELSEAARAFIRREYGTNYATNDAIVSTGIAPADADRLPEDLPGDGAALYGLIWRSFLAAHLPPAQERLATTRILVGASKEKPYPLELRAAGRRLYFDGWQRLLPGNHDESLLPPLLDGDLVRQERTLIEAVSTVPPERFTSAGMTLALADLGLDVAASARAVEGLVEAEYTLDSDDGLTLTEVGQSVTEALAETFADLTSPELAAELAGDLERIAAGEESRSVVLRAFWGCFGAALRPADPERAAGEHRPVVLRPAEEA